MLAPAFLSLARFPMYRCRVNYTPPPGFLQLLVPSLRCSFNNCTHSHWMHGIPTIPIPVQTSTHAHSIDIHVESHHIDLLHSVYYRQCWSNSTFIIHNKMVALIFSLNQQQYDLQNILSCYGGNSFTMLELLLDFMNYHCQLQWPAQSHVKHRHWYNKEGTEIKLQISSTDLIIFKVFQCIADNTDSHID